MCSLLDVRSLFNFRHANCHAQQIVRETSGYEAVITHALAALCVTLRTNIASWFNFSDLTKALCTRACHICGSFSGFIFLPSFMRCCSCIREDSLPSILSLSVLKNRVESSSGCQYSLVPTVKSLPQNGICCSGCQIALEKALWSSRIQSNACAPRDKVYSYDEFMEHFWNAARLKTYGN